MKDNSFDNISNRDMEDLADAIEEYKDSLMRIMIIPKKLLERDKKKIKKAIQVTEKLIKKLKNHDRSVFMDPDEMELDIF